MRGARSRNKGARAARAVVRWLRSPGWPDARRYLAGDGRQPGDSDGGPGVAIEGKDQARYDIPAWLRQAIAEAGPNLPVVCIHPQGVSHDTVGDWWAVLRLSDLAGLLHDDQ